MKEVFILFRRLHDPYGCLEFNDDEILGVFTSLEKATEIKQDFKNKDIRKRFEFWIDNYIIDEIQM